MHLYECFDLSALFEAGHRNLRAISAGGSPRDDDRYVLMLAESGGDDRFSDVASAADTRDGALDGGPWRATRLPDDPCALQVSDQAGRDLVLVAGSQIVTTESIEILALGSLERFPDGETADTTLNRVHDSDALAVVPWGAGKWFGRRGRLVERLLRSGNHVCLADNAGRPSFWPRGTLFALAEELGRPILSGSDPLPLRGQELSVGRAGCRLEGDMPMTQPTPWLTRGLRTSGPRMETFGRREGALPFLKNQLLLRRQSAS